MTTKPWGVLPVSRITTIMKSSSDAEAISKESSQLMTKATELFIRALAREAFKLLKSSDKNLVLDYKQLAEIVHSDSKYEFLRDIMPKKITVLEYKKILAKQQQQQLDNGDNNRHDSTSSSSEDEEEEEEENRNNSSHDSDGDNSTNSSNSSLSE